MAFVKLHGAARAVDDEDALGAGGFEYFVHPRRHLADALRGVWTSVVVPHITDDDRRLVGVPLMIARYGVVAARLRRRFLWQSLWRRFLPRAEVKLQRLGRGRV